MREVGRIQQGFFPTPDRVVEWIANMLTPEVTENGTVTVVDAGCGEGKAISDLRGFWQKKFPDLNCRLLGVESDKNRAEKALELFRAGLRFAELVPGPAQDDLAAVINVAGDQVLEAERLGPAVVNGQVVDGETGLQGGVFVKVVDDHLGDGVALDFNHHARVFV